MIMSSDLPIASSFVWTPSWIFVSSSCALPVTSRPRHVVAFYVCSSCVCDVCGGRSYWYWHHCYYFLRLAPSFSIWTQPYIPLQNYYPVLEEEAHQHSEVPMVRLDRPHVVSFSVSNPDTAAERIPRVAICSVPEPPPEP